MTQRAEIDRKRAGETAARLPRVICGNYPTPLEEMTRLREMLGRGCPRIFIKRDDYTGTAFGSNKLRKLDFAIANEIERGTNVIVTIAGECSNHARVTAAVCAKFGLKCVLVLNRTDPQKVPYGMVPASRFVYEAFGADVRWVDTRDEREPVAMDIVDSINANGQRASYLPLGVSFPLGAFGFVEAVREIENQFREFGSFPDHVFHASTSGGTQAGILSGLRSAGRKTKVIGVSPDDPRSDVQKRIASIIEGMGEFVECRVGLDEITVLDEFIGEGYGIATEASSKTIELAARTEGVILDNTYTAKAFAAMLDWIASERFGPTESILFWHTGGHLAPFYAPVI